ncbi:RNA-directed DNA polymerase, eukaryota [Tanacetum coccineum]
MGDFNEVRNKNERFGTIFNVQGANAFNSFISMANLEEVPLGGCYYTWCHRSASKMSKLDRFLMSESLLRECPNFSAITLDRYLSNHRPILLRESTHDYGPIPFRSSGYVQCYDKPDEQVEISKKEDSRLERYEAKPLKSKYGVEAGARELEYGIAKEMLSNEILTNE